MRIFSWIPRDLIKPILLLGGCSILIVALIVSPFFHMQLQALWWWLPWNLFLAWMPLFFALLAQRVRKGKIGKVLAVPFWGLWFLFFPNAPYMLTNLIHLNFFEFYTRTEVGDFYSTVMFSGEPTVWFGFLLLIAGVAIGSVVGSLSLTMVHRHIKKKYGNIWAWGLVAGVSLFSGFAIWLGRILRFNSWDVIFRPFPLFRNIIEQFSWSAFLLCMLFAIMSIGAYLLTRLFVMKDSDKLVADKQNNDENTNM